MKLSKCEVINFGSYTHLEFDFSDLGLALVHGPTGSGKSSLFDIPCWALFGVTAKNGAVDEVRSWKSDKATSVDLQITTQNDSFRICRVRGSAKENDLYICKDGELTRGKDLNDTQQKINSLLGIDADTYLASSYLSEFSEVANFFTNTAKSRRQLLDLIADTALADKLTEVIPGRRKSKKVEFDKAEKKFIIDSNNFTHLQSKIKDSSERAERWDTVHQERIQAEITKRDNFDLVKKSKVAALLTAQSVRQTKTNEKLSAIEKKLLVLNDKLDKYCVKRDAAHPCPTCGAVKDSSYSQAVEAAAKDSFDVYAKLHTELLSEVDPYVAQIKEASLATNEYAASIDDLKTHINPYEEQKHLLAEECYEKHEALKKQQSEVKKIENDLSLLDDLYDISATLRSHLVAKSVKEIQDQANDLLQRFFDGELRLTLTTTENDSIDIEITKNSYQCVYSQLSKGQRGLLKLCFSIAVMKAASNKAGKHFDNIFLDEALDGLDPELKVKAYSLLSELSIKHSTVMVIEHSSEFKVVFEKQISVILNNDESTIR